MIHFFPDDSFRFILDDVGGESRQSGGSRRSGPGEGGEDLLPLGERPADLDSVQPRYVLPSQGGGLRRTSLHQGP